MIDRFAKDSSPLMGNGSGMNGYGGEEMRGKRDKGRGSRTSNTLQVKILDQLTLE